MCRHVAIFESIEFQKIGIPLERSRSPMLCCLEGEEPELVKICYQNPVSALSFIFQEELLRNAYFFSRLSICFNNSPCFSCRNSLARSFNSVLRTATAVGVGMSSGDCALFGDVAAYDCDIVINAGVAGRGEMWSVIVVEDLNAR